MQISCSDIAGMVSIDKSRDTCGMSLWLGHVGWQFFLNIMIKFFAICIVMKGVLINVRGMSGALGSKACLPISK